MKLLSQQEITLWGENESGSSQLTGNILITFWQGCLNIIRMFIQIYLVLKNVIKSLAQKHHTSFMECFFPVEKNSICWLELVLRWSWADLSWSSAGPEQLRTSLNQLKPAAMLQNIPNQHMLFFFSTGFSFFLFWNVQRTFKSSIPIMLADCKMECSLDIFKKYVLQTMLYQNVF